MFVLPYSTALRYEREHLKTHCQFYHLVPLSYRAPMNAAVVTGLQMNTGDGLIDCLNARSRKRTAQCCPLVSDGEKSCPLGLGSVRGRRVCATCKNTVDGTGKRNLFKH
jgi:hypothetical protein